METNLAKQPSLTGVLVAPRLGHPTGGTKVVGLIPTWNSEICSVIFSPVAKQLSLRHFIQGLFQRHSIVFFFACKKSQNNCLSILDIYKDNFNC